MAVTLTEAAAERVKHYLAADAASAGLRFGVKTTGCSGYAYVVDITDEVAAVDHVFESRGVRIFVDPESLGLVDGTCIDFRKDGLSESFQFANPKAGNLCGCGESFSVA